MLPSEDLARHAIAERYAQEFAAMTALHNVVVDMFGGGWTIPLEQQQGTSPQVVHTAAGLLTKACKSFRAVQLLCEAGLGTDAAVVNRSLYETAVAVLFILAADCRKRAYLYHLHSQEMTLKTLRQWRDNPALAALVSDELLANAQLQTVEMRERFPGVNVRRHWSGYETLREVVSALKGDVSYDVFYRLTSTNAHGADFSQHVTINHETDEMVFELEPRLNGIEAVTHQARQFLWTTASRIDERLGLGFADVLKPHQPSEKQFPPPAEQEKCDEEDESNG